jgi:hypothetical protein
MSRRSMIDRSDVLNLELVDRMRAGGEPNAVALQRNPARAQATPRSRRRLVAVSAIALSVCTASR